MAAMTISFDINCENVAVSPNNGRSVTVSLSDVSQSDLIEILEIPKNYSPDDIFSVKELEEWATDNGFEKP